MNTLEIASTGAISLFGLLKESGKFRYRYDSKTDDDASGYNVLRHAGAIWSMLDVYRDTGNKHLLDGARQASTFLIDTYLRFFRSYNNVCICEDNKIKLGGNALTALALLALHDSTKDKILLTISDHLCEFMLNQREETGELVHKRYFKSGKVSAFKSMYYTGEAMLAMLALYRSTQDEKWRKHVIDIEKDLAKEDYGVNEQSHWMLYSLELLSHLDTSDFIYEHARKIACHILDNPDYLGWNRSTPIACRSEGLLAFVRTRRPDTSEENDLKNKCIEQVRENLTRQLDFRLSDGTFIRGGGDRRHDEVRIDYIQHNISSFLHFHRISTEPG